MAYEFQGFHLDADRRRLLAAGSAEAIHVSPKVLETLVYLVEHRGELVEKDALVKAIWPRVVVEENSLDRNISTLRRVLGERAGENRFIATVPGRGYRFVAEVTVVAPGRGPAVAVLSAASSETPGGQRASEAPAARWHRIAPSALGVVSVALVLAATAAVIGNLGRQESDSNVSVHQLEPATSGPAGGASTLPRASVAVIPLANLTGDPSLQYVGDGIATELIYSLSRVKGLKVPGSKACR